MSGIAEPIVNPEIPYCGEIAGGLQLGKMCRLQGVTHPNADRFSINFQVGPNRKPRDDTSLHLSVRLNQGYIARNSYKDGTWGDEQGSGTLPIGQAQAWEILILIDNNDYKIAVNGQHFCEFPYRIPFNDVTHLLIDGDVSITLISWEGIAGVAGTETSSTVSQVNAEVSPQGAFAPPGPGGYAPQAGGYGPPPGGYAPPPGGYGPPPAGYYGPPVPPGAPQESKFDFLEQAQSVLAGAIRSGAAEKLLGGLLSSGQQPQGQGYAPQNAQYGHYPQPAPQQQTAGPVESLLSGLLSGGGQSHQQPHGPQIGGGPSIGGLGSMSGILSDFAGQMFNPRGGGQHQ